MNKKPNQVWTKALFFLGTIGFFISSAFAASNSAPYLNLRGVSIKAYQIGDIWGKKPLNQNDLSNAVLQRLALATAHISNATGFYIGRYAGYDILATNHHVCPTALSCSNSTVTFDLLQEEYRVRSMIGSWPEIDLALLVIESETPGQEGQLAQVAVPFSFFTNLTEGTPLVTIGYGIGENPGEVLMINQDSDCKIFSKKNEFRFMGDPDQFNTSSYKAWSFSMGCDVSHGDSGSAIVNRMTGEVVGILWTGKTPKASQVQSSNYLNTILGTDHPDIWTELSFAVPAPKIYERLSELLAQGVFVPANANIVAAILGRH